MKIREEVGLPGNLFGMFQEKNKATLGKGSKQVTVITDAVW